MNNILTIYDPREIRKKYTQTNNHQMNAGESYALNRDQLIVGFIYEDKIRIRPAILLKQILESFSADNIFFSFYSPPKYNQKIMDCFRPDIKIANHSGVFTYNYTNLFRIAQCFRLHCEWFYWKFGIFNKEYTPKIIEIAEKRGLIEFSNEDPLCEYIHYSIYMNFDMGDVTILVNQEDLFDDFISLLKKVIKIG